MKFSKLMAISVMALGVCAFAAQADDDVYAYSVNAVGVIKKTVPAGKMILVSVPLDLMESTNSTVLFSDVVAFTNLPNGSSASVWDVTNQVWVSAAKSRGKWPVEIASQPIGVGQPIFLKNGGSSDVVLSLMGEVPSDASMSVALAGAGAMQTCANPYPVSCVFVETSLASNAVNGSGVNFWDVENGTWIVGTKNRGAWNTAVRTLTVSPAEGFFFKSGDTATAQAWVVNKPYQWPEE